MQDFLNQTRALFNNSSRIRAAPEGGLVLRQGACTSALEAMCLCFINSWSQRLRLCREIAAALAACHAAGVLHRDLTSFNIMLSDMLEVQPGAETWALSWSEAVRLTPPRRRGIPRAPHSACVMPGVACSAALTPLLSRLF